MNCYFISVILLKINQDPVGSIMTLEPLLHRPSGMTCYFMSLLKGQLAW